MVAQLGGSAAHIGRIGADQYGEFYAGEFDRFAIVWSPVRIAGERTGTVIALIDDDKERTMCVNRGTNASFSAGDIDLNVVRASRWLLIQGHYMTYGQEVVDALQMAARFARSNGTRVMLSLGAETIVTRARDAFMRFLPEVDVVIGNEHESRILSDALSLGAAFNTLRNKCPGVVITLGEKGALAGINGEECLVSGPKVVARDKTGAGDAFAGGFLYGLSAGMPLYTSLFGATRVAAQVVSELGARSALDKDVLRGIFTS